MSGPRLLWGVCGIGLGHARRQLPLLQHYAQQSDIAIFTYGAALAYLRSRFAGRRNVQFHNVSVPYWLGKPNGLDFAGAAMHPANTQLDFSANATAMAKAEAQLGKPHLVVSDYEPVSAQYAYALNAPLVTLDQQSKYIGAQLPAQLHGTGYADEVMRLNMFFPKAAARLACSFFNVEQKKGCGVRLIPPIIAPEILQLERKPAATPLVLVYLSEQLNDAAIRAQLLAVLAKCPQVQFVVYLPRTVKLSAPAPHIKFYAHGAASFMAHLASCHGLVSTAGHSLLSEAMQLAIPVLALPLKLYEQQMNAAVIEQGGFGLCRQKLDVGSLREFLAGLPVTADIIRTDKKTLLRGDGALQALKLLGRLL